MRIGWSFTHQDVPIGAGSGKKKVEEFGRKGCQGVCVGGSVCVRACVRAVVCGWVAGWVCGWVRWVRCVWRG